MVKKVQILGYTLFMVLFVLLFSLHANPIRIGVTLGLTGKYAQLAQAQAKAFRLWETEINSEGGILNRPVQIIIHDDKGQEKNAIKLYRQMITQEFVDLLFAPYSSQITQAVLPVTESHCMPILISGAAADAIWDQGYQYVFGIYPPASRYTLGFQEMISVSGITRLALVSGKDSFSISIAEGARTWAERLQMEILVEKSDLSIPDDYIATAETIKKLNVEAVIVCGHYLESIFMRNAFKKIQWYPMAYYASVGPTLRSYRSELGEDANLTFSSSQWQYYEKLAFPGAKRFYEKFVSRYKEAPSYHAATAYTAGFLLNAAIKKAGRIDHERIRQILSTMDIMTPLGRYGVDRTGMQIKFFPLVIQWIDGNKEVVWPIDLRTKNPVYHNLIPERQP